MKKCGSCKNYLEENQFSLRKGKLQSFCKECQKKYSKMYRAKNKDSCRKNLQDWRKRQKKEN